MPTPINSSFSPSALAGKIQELDLAVIGQLEKIDQDGRGLNSQNSIQIVVSSQPQSRLDLCAAQNLVSRYRQADFRYPYLDVAIAINATQIILEFSRKEQDSEVSDLIAGSLSNELDLTAGVALERANERIRAKWSAQEIMEQARQEHSGIPVEHQPIITKALKILLRMSSL